MIDPLADWPASGSIASESAGVDVGEERTGSADSRPADHRRPTPTRVDIERPDRSSNIAIPARVSYSEDQDPGFESPERVPTPWPSGRSEPDGPEDDWLSFVPSGLQSGGSPSAQPVPTPDPVPDLGADPGTTTGPDVAPIVPLRQLFAGTPRLDGPATASTTGEFALDTGHGASSSSCGCPSTASGGVDLTIYEYDGAPYTEGNENANGGIVVKRADGNDAPRQKIEINGSTDPNALECRATLSWDSGNIELYTQEEGGGKISSGVQYLISDLPKTFWVQGVTESGSMGDITLTLRHEDAGVPPDTAKFTVVYADQPTIKSSGTASPDNEVAGLWSSMTMSGTAELGPLVKYVHPVLPNNMGVARVFETKSVVHPADFGHPSASVQISREVNVKGYEGFSPGNGLIGGKNGDDTGPPEWRDDNPYNPALKARSTTSILRGSFPKTPGKARTGSCG